MKAKKPKLSHKPPVPLYQASASAPTPAPASASAPAPAPASDSASAIPQLHPLNELFNGKKEITVQEFLKFLAKKLKPYPHLQHPYVQRVITVTLAGDEKKIIDSHAKAFFDCFGHESLERRIERICESLIHPNKGIRPWFWGFLHLEEVDNILAQASEDSSFLLRINHKKHGTISLSYVKWLPENSKINQVEQKFVHTIRINWNEEEKGFKGQFITDESQDKWKTIGPYRTILDLIDYCRQAEYIQYCMPSDLAVKLDPKKFKKDFEKARARILDKNKQLAKLADPVSKPGLFGSLVGASPVAASGGASENPIVISEGLVIKLP